MAKDYLEGKIDLHTAYPDLAMSDIEELYLERNVHDSVYSATSIPLAPDLPAFKQYIQKLPEEKLVFRTDAVGFPF